MTLELDHVFICVERDAPEAEHLAQIGLRKTRHRTHKGQGTANTCFFFENMILELLWVCDEEEVRSPLVQPTRLWERWRWRETGSCPFGICFRTKEILPELLPFSTWEYKPPYLPKGASIPIAVNSKRTAEPLIFVSPVGTRPDTYPEEHRPVLDHPVGWREVTAVQATLPMDDPSPELQRVQQLGLIRVRPGAEHGLEIWCDEGPALHQVDLRPELPLVFRW